MMGDLRIGLVVAGLLACGSARAQTIGPPYQIQCNKVTQGSATVQIATSVTNQTIFVCGWDVEATGAGSWSLSQGTGSTCATNTVALSPAYSAMVAGGVAIDHPSFAFEQTAATTNLCVTVSTAVNWVVYWGQY